ncbi:DUF1330 domain-containing protein [Phytoactinopolyspora halotolerans]|uniref:DUF1330 domain-containing protein n=1 Tax=Phytoactinopolyspora halotolerans TaxID=1981512 RepID=A0A6L9S121_9ACTN|nr:DUF1330 domain-containing protein [Phytoactinopolyspora halotolerans]NED98550.1 DUF1330 domain-containing protein [Phytoactinopolyspora halotolerans]
MDNRNDGRPARAYAIAHLGEVRMGEEIVSYLRGIDATLAPFGGRFIVHGGAPTVLEGTWSGDLVMIEFPDRDSALAWYESEAYQRILPLRTRNASGPVIVMEGVGADHVATDILSS